MSRLEAIASPLALALGIAAALMLVSCGGGDDAELLPGGTAREITANLDAVEQLASEGDCVGAESAAEQVSVQVETLQGVDETLVRALERGAARLNEVVATCEETEEIAPTIVPETEESTTSESEEKEREKEEKEREKEEEEAEKEEEEEEEESEGGPPTEVPPPNSNGQGSGEGPSGGIGPGAAVGGDD